MIDLREIQETIQEIRAKGTSIKEAEHLALLYIARDYMEREERPAIDDDTGYSRAASPPARQTVAVEPKTEFLEACNGLEVERLLAVLSEHFEACRVVTPKVYESLIGRLRAEK